uniref:deoxyribose-phosphate aldolase n=1 Tax=Lynceus sp. MCZ IZ 141354 TaxID=1930659 RepID=A0A9N6WRB0_9CRUS|nr:EOG090X08W6 [Lynceus sp. MCZ IZ 141354]
MDVRNLISELDQGWVNSVVVNDYGVRKRVQDLCKYEVAESEQLHWLVRAIQCIDLTTLAGDDCPSNVRRLCHKACHPIKKSLAEQYGLGYVKTAAVCVYPARVPDAARSLRELNCEGVNIASVATGFPSGQTPLTAKLEEIRYAVEHGANEIDIVISRELAITHQWEKLHEELVAMRKACGEAHMKSILAVGELGTLSNVYKASLVAMMAGSDFIKTSTGKEATNATLPVGVVMCRAIREYYRMTGHRVGFKPAGGVRSSKDVLQWLVLIKKELGDDWLNPSLFRIGASALLNDIERNIYTLLTGEFPCADEMPMA